MSCIHPYHTGHTLREWTRILKQTQSTPVDHTDKKKAKKLKRHKKKMKDARSISHAKSSTFPHRGRGTYWQGIEEGMTAAKSVHKSKEGLDKCSYGDRTGLAYLRSCSLGKCSHIHIIISILNYVHQYFQLSPFLFSVICQVMTMYELSPRCSFSPRIVRACTRFSYFFTTFQASLVWIAW